MATNLTVQAKVVDIRSDTPFPYDTFFVDSNVWYWLTYPRASLAFKPPKSYQINNYPFYISQALSARSSLYYSGFSLAELAHLVEKTEGEIFYSSTYNLKEYRHNYPVERTKVVTQVQSVWSQVKAGQTHLSFVKLY